MTPRPRMQQGVDDRHRRVIPNRDERAARIRAAAESPGADLRLPAVLTGKRRIEIASEQGRPRAHCAIKR